MASTISLVNSTSGASMPAPMSAPNIPGQVKGHPLATQLQGSGDPRKLFSSADYRNFTLVDRLSRKQPNYTEEQYGTVYPWVGAGENPFPSHKLTYQEEDQDGEHVVRYYDSDWAQADQQPSNAVISFSGDDEDFPAYTRLYIIPRSIFTPLARLAPLSGLSRAIVTAGGQGYTKDSVVTLSGGTGSGGSVQCFVNPAGEVVDIQILSPGSYTVAPTVSISIGTGAVASVAIQPQTCVLTKEEEIALQDQHVTSLYVGVRRYWETLPGPQLPFTRYDIFLGPVQGYRRAVANTGQAPSLTNTTKTTYESREGSAIVSWELVESWTSGSGATTAGLFPVVPAPIYYDNDRGNVKSFSQIVTYGPEVYSASVVSGGAGGTPGAVTITGTTGTGTKFQATGTINGGGVLTGALIVTVGGSYSIRPTNLAVEPVTGGGLAGATVLLTMDASENGTLAVTNGVAREVRYEPYDQFHMKKVVMYYVIPGPTVRNAQRNDDWLGKIYGTRQLVIESGQLLVQSNAGQTRYSDSPMGAPIIWEIIETWDNTLFPQQLDDFFDDQRSSVHQVAQLSVDLATLGTLVVATGVATDTRYKAYNKYLRTKIIETWDVPGTARTYSVYGRRGFTGTLVRTRVAPTSTPAVESELIDVERTVESKVQVREDVLTYAAGGSPLVDKFFNRFGGLNTRTDKFAPPSTTPTNVTNTIQELRQEKEKQARLIETVIATGSAITTIDNVDPSVPGSRATQELSLVLASASMPSDTATEVYERLEFPDNPLQRILKKTTFAVPSTFIESEDHAFAFPSLFYNFQMSDLLGSTRTERGGFSVVVPHKVTHSFGTARVDISPYQIIENDYLVFSMQIRGLTNAVQFYKTIGGVIYYYPASGTLAASTPSRSTYEGLINTLLTVGGGSTVWRAGIFHTRTIEVLAQ